MGTLLAASVVIILAARSELWGGAMLLGVFATWHATEIGMAHFIEKYSKKRKAKDEDK